MMAPGPEFKAVTHPVRLMGVAGSEVGRVEEKECAAGWGDLNEDTMGEV